MTEVHPTFMRNLLAAFNFREVTESKNDTARKYGSYVYPQSVHDWTSKLEDNIKSRLTQSQLHRKATIVQSIRNSSYLMKFLYQIVAFFRSNPSILNANVPTNTTAMPPTQDNHERYKGLFKKRIVHPLSTMPHRNMLHGMLPNNGLGHPMYSPQFVFMNTGAEDDFGQFGGQAMDGSMNNPDEMQVKRLMDIQQSKGSGLLKAMYERSVKHLSTNGKALAEEDRQKMNDMWDSIKTKEEQLVHFIVYLDKFNKLRRSHPDLVVNNGGTDYSIDDIINHVNKNMDKLTQKYENKQWNFISVLQSLEELLKRTEQFSTDDQNVSRIQPAPLM
jgi:hypothetical protein